MKRIKNRLSYIVILAAMPLVFGCSKNFLEHEPPGALGIDVLANKRGVTKLLVGAYAALDGQNDNGDMINLNGGGGYAVSPDNWIYGSVAGGDAHKGSTSGDQDDILRISAFTADPTVSFFNDKWVCAYEGIKRCNSVLSTLKDVTDMTDEEKTEMAAEARFLRGHYFFDLRKMFKKVPWVSEDSTNLNVRNDQEIYPFIEADFQFAMENLPPTQPQVGQVNKYAAEVYLAKTYLYEKNYAAALPLFTDAINNGQTSNGLKYDLVKRFQDNWDAATENNAESVFAIQNNVADGTVTAANANQGDMLNYPNIIAPCCGFFQPSFDLVNSFRTTSAGLPYLDDYNSHPVKNDEGIPATSDFTPDDGPLDPRLDWTPGRRGIPYL
ncbi:MAG TPA: RagB/SusD family nutrient uptake outer membrane protein, partial [Chitinophaga sp.]